MVLGFSTHFPKDKGSLSGKETLFVDKILNQSKIHTIRKDVANRWKKGRLISPVLHHRTKHQHQFAPTLFCINTQKIEISYKHGQTYIKIDDKEIDFVTAVILAKNDGFDSLADFLTYFNEDFTGKIIHWTKFKY